MGSCRGCALSSPSIPIMSFRASTPRTASDLQPSTSLPALEPNLESNHKYLIGEGTDPGDAAEQSKLCWAVLLPLGVIRTSGSFLTFQGSDNPAQEELWSGGIFLR